MDKGFDVTFLDVDASGQIKPEDLKKAIRKDTIGFSAIAVHNEIGTINKLAELGSICRENKVIFHTDCAQAFGKIPLNVKDMCIDLMSISGHKVSLHSFKNLSPFIERIQILTIFRSMDLWELELYTLEKASLDQELESSLFSVEVVRREDLEAELQLLP